MLIKAFKAKYPQAELISSNDTFFSTIKSSYKQKKDSGLFMEDGTKAIYIMCVERGESKHWGIVAHNDTTDFASKNILVHENTLEAKEQKMMEFIMGVKTMVKPVLLAHDPVPDITKWIKKNSKGDPKLVFPFEEKGEVHKIWKVESPKQIAKVVALYMNVDTCYLADGHHRSATILSMFNSKLVSKQARSNGILCAYFHFDQLQIFDYNRIIDLGNEMSAVEFITKLSKYCRLKALKKGRKPKRVHQMTIFINGEWLEATWRKKVIKEHKKEVPLLDARLFNRYISTDIMSVKDIREDRRIKYFEGTIGVDEIEKRHGHKKHLAICFLKPILSDDLKYVADHHQVLPPKTTWFEPRIRSGMLVSEF